MVQRAETDYPVQDLIAARWSPYLFANKPVSKADLCSLFEAARWAPSSYNEQPWSYVLATQDDRPEFDRLLSCLVPGNQAWAKFAPVLALGCTNLKLTKSGQPNEAAQHDLGLSSANLVLEATARGLTVHQMIGILPDRARQLYEVPEDVRPLTALAIGYAGDPDGLSAEIANRDLTRRPRKPIAAFIFTGKWGSTSGILGQ